VGTFHNLTTYLLQIVHGCDGERILKSDLGLYLLRNVVVWKLHPWSGRSFAVFE